MNFEELKKNAMAEMKNYEKILMTKLRKSPERPSNRDRKQEKSAPETNVSTILQLKKKKFF